MFVTPKLILQVRGPLSRKTAPLMLVGAPGTGKTHLVSRLGEMTGLPVVSIQFSKYSGHDGIAGDDCRFNFSNKRGIVADMLLDGAGKTANCANKIVLLDEIDKVQGIHNVTLWIMCMLNV